MALDTPVSVPSCTVDSQGPIVARPDGLHLSMTPCSKYPANRMGYGVQLRTAPSRLWALVTPGDTKVEGKRMAPSQSQPLFEEPPGPSLWHETRGASGPPNCRSLRGGTGSSCSGTCYQLRLR